MTAQSSYQMFIQPWWKPRNLIGNIRIFVERGLHGYSRYDLWDYGDYTVHIMSEGLKDFKRDQYSFPASFDDPEDWDELLNEIVNALSVLDLYDEDIYQNWTCMKEYPEQEFKDRRKLIDCNREIAKKFFDQYDGMWW